MFTLRNKIYHGILLLSNTYHLLYAIHKEVAVMVKIKINDLLRSSGDTINSLSNETQINRASLTKLANNEAKMIQFETIDKLMSHFDLYSFDDLFVSDFNYDDIEFSIDFYDYDPHPSLDSFGWIYLYKNTDDNKKKILSILPMSLKIKSAGDITSYTVLCKKDRFSKELSGFPFFDNYLKKGKSETIELFLMNICKEITKGMTARGTRFYSRDVISFKTDFNNTANYLWPYYLLSDEQLSKDLFTDTID